MTSGQILDICQFDESNVSVTIKTQKSTKTIVVNVPTIDILFTVPIWNEDDYKKRGYEVIKSTSFFDGFDNGAVVVGICKTKNAKQSLTELKKNKGLVVYNQSTLLDHYIKSTGLCSGLNVEIDEKLKIKPVPDAISHTGWIICSVHCEIEKPQDRSNPVANWKLDAKKHGMDYPEVMDEPTQSIKHIELATYSYKEDGTFHAVKKKIYHWKDDEMTCICSFMDDFDNMKDIDCLLSWDYEYALTYVYKRFLYHGGDENVFFQKVYRKKDASKAARLLDGYKYTQEHAQECIALEYLFYDSISGMPYLSMFHLHRTLIKSEHVGFSKKNVSMHHFGKVYDTNDLNMKLAHDLGFISWYLQYSQLFGTTYRTILGPFWKILNRYLINRYPSTKYVFTMKPLDFYKEKSSGGLVLDSEKGRIIQNAWQPDVNSCYPSTIIENNICYTTITTKVTKDVNVVDLIELEVKSDVKVATFVKPSVKKGELPIILQETMSERKKTQALLKDCKDPNNRIFLDMKQLALKLFGNKIFGMTNSQSIFKNNRMSRAITSYAQGILKRLMKMIQENEKYRQEIFIVGGDTDALMLQTENEDLLQELVTEFNKEYQFIKIGVDRKFDKVYFINNKNYFGWKNNKLVEKGTESIRKDRLKITKEITRLFMGHILNGPVDTDLKEVLKVWIEKAKESHNDLLLDDDYTFGKFKFLESKQDPLDRLETETITKAKELIDTYEELYINIL